LDHQRQRVYVNIKSDNIKSNTENNSGYFPYLHIYLFTVYLTTLSIVNILYTYRVSQEGRSVFWEVIVSVILRKNCIYTCVQFRTVSEIELFHCTVPNLLLRKRYYVLFLIPVFTVHVTKLVQFTYKIYFRKFHRQHINALCNSCEDMACCSSVQCTVYCTVK
jgi:hypothetical protein